MRIEKPVNGEPVFKIMPPLIPIDKKEDKSGTANYYIRNSFYYWGFRTIKEVE